MSPDVGGSGRYSELPRPQKKAARGERRIRVSQYLGQPAPPAQRPERRLRDGYPGLTRGQRFLPRTRPSARYACGTGEVKAAQKIIAAASGEPVRTGARPCPGSPITRGPRVGSPSLRAVRGRPEHARRIFVPSWPPVAPNRSSSRAPLGRGSTASRYSAVNPRCARPRTASANASGCSA